MSDGLKLKLIKLICNVDSPALVFVPYVNALKGLGTECIRAGII